MSESIGMMDKAYFVGKVEILNWMNSTLQLQLAKIEQCATGAVYCAVMDSIYPGSFHFTKVKWNAKHEYEFVENYKVLQQAFDRNGIKRHIDVAKLVKAKYLDNLEFCQWLKAYWEKNYNGDEYDALARRRNQELHYILGGGKVGPPPQRMPAQAAAARAQPASNTGPTQARAGGPPRQAAGGGIGGGAAASGAQAAKVKELEAQIQELRLQNDTLDKERDFYFSKLRDIELLLQARQMEAGPGNDMSQDILKILYAAEDEKVEVSQTGELTITAPGGEKVTGEIVNAPEEAVAQENAEMAEDTNEME